MEPRELRVVRAAEVVERPAEEPPWLVEDLRGAGAVGVFGGMPKSCKTWLVLEIAVAVASGRPCLGPFAVPSPGTVLLFAAEDALEQIRLRVENLARARGADFETLDVRLILEPALRLDREDHLERLRRTLAKHRPRLLILDPWVRLQRADENHATEVSPILGAPRELSRAFDLALLVVRHARKNPALQAGQALRGSSDFHAWGDSNLYLARWRTHLVMSVEHRFAAAAPPVALVLVSEEESPVGLEIRDGLPTTEDPPLAERLLESLADGQPHRQADLRRELRVRNQILTEALRELEASGQVAKSPEGWRRLNGSS